MRADALLKLGRRLRPPTGPSELIHDVTWEVADARRPRHEIDVAAPPSAERGVHVIGECLEITPRLMVWDAVGVPVIDQAAMRVAPWMTAIWVEVSLQAIRAIDRGPLLACERKTIPAGAHRPPLPFQCPLMMLE